MLFIYIILLAKNYIIRKIKLINKYIYIEYNFIIIIINEMYLK